MKVLVVGLNPSVKGGKSTTLKNLTEWLNLLNLQYVSFINAYDTYGKVSISDLKKDELIEKSKGYAKVIALGSLASKSLISVGIDHFKLPHPSGLNRQLNNQDFIHSKLNECKEYLCT